MHVLVVDDEPGILQTLTISLESMGFEVVPCKGPLEGLEAARNQEHSFDLAFIDLKMHPIDGIDLMRRIQLLQPDTTCVIITAHGTVNTAVDAIKKGAYDYLQKPFDLAELREFIRKVEGYHEQKERYRVQERRDRRNGVDIITSDQKMLELIALAERVANTPLTVLIEGESGTGKELFARLIHERSGRRNGPFVSINCAALPENLLESELFGHVKGAFTGAHQDRVGRFELADGGTIFLDEIGELSPALQAKLLRVLQQKEFERVGESRSITTDARVVAATNVDLEKAIADGEFRQDLFYRLNAVRIQIPPLRARRGDIPTIAAYFVERFSDSNGELKVFSDRALSGLMAYDWKGNVRELENVVSRAYYLSRGSTIELDDLPEEFRESTGTDQPMSLEEVEREHIRKVLRESESYDEAARRLNIDPATLWRKRKKYDL